MASKCMSCGKEITAAQAIRVSKRFRHNGKFPVCPKCQTERFDSLNSEIKNPAIALYVMCAMLDFPFWIAVASDAVKQKEKNTWNYYYDAVSKDEKLSMDHGETISFADGEASFKGVLNLASGGKVQSAKNIDALEKAREKWGIRYIGDSEDGTEQTRSYTDDELCELENFYKEQAAEFKGGLTPRIKNAIREICICRLEWKRCTGRGDSQSAKRYSDMIKDIMAREGMRAGDAKPLEAMRIDSIIDHLEKKGAVKDGKIVGKKELIKILAKDHPKYNTSLDIVDAMMMAIVNTMRKNNGFAEVERLPLAAQVKDVFGELLTAPSSIEKQAMAKMGMVKTQREKEQQGGGTDAL